MEIIANRIVDYLDTDKTIWNDVDRMRMSLGLQVIIHNIVMIGTILLVSKIAWLLRIVFPTVLLAFPIPLKYR